MLLHTTISLMATVVEVKSLQCYDALSVIIPGDYSLFFSCSRQFSITTLLGFAGSLHIDNITII